MSLVRRLPIVAAILLAGCQGADPDALGLQAVWNEAKDLPVNAVVWLWLRDVIFGVLLGALIGFVLFLALKKCRCYRIVGGIRTWILVLIGLFMTAGGGVLGGIVGNLQAGIDIAELGIRDSAIGKKALPAVGEMAADFLAYVEQLLLHGKNLDAVDLNDFQKGKAVVNVGKVVDGLSNLQKDAAQKLAAAAIERTLLQHPDWAGGTTEKAARWALPLLASYLVDEHVRRKMADVGFPDFLDDLAAEAKRRPDGAMSREEIGVFFTKRVLEPAILKPIRRAIRQTQMIFLFVGVGGALAPIGLIELGRWLKKSPSK